MAYTPTVWADGDTITAEKLNKLEQGVANEQVGPPGTAGADGAPGADGKDGAPGKSAYQIAVDNGFTGTETEWLSSLKGSDGAPGQDGADGAPGTPGRDGQDGADGAPGADGFSPTVSVTDITGGHRVTITDATGPHTFDVMDGQDGTGGGSEGVSSFNGRSGDVLPQSGDYTADMVGARASDWMPSAADVGALPADASIPPPLRSVTITLTASDWADGTQTTQVAGVLADETKQLIQPVPASTSKTAYYDAGIQCVSQAAGTLTFQAETAPDADLTVYVAIQEVAE